MERAWMFVELELESCLRRRSLLWWPVSTWLTLNWMLECYTSDWCPAVYHRPLIPALYYPRQELADNVSVVTGEGRRGGGTTQLVHRWRSERVREHRTQREGVNIRVPLTYIFLNLTIKNNNRSSNLIWEKNINCFQSDNNINLMRWRITSCIHYTQALHTDRINLSPFTKDFRVWGAPIETYLFLISYLRVTSST